MKPRRALIVFKKSLYRIYNEDYRTGKGRTPPVGKATLRRLKKEDRIHENTMTVVRRALDAAGIMTREIYRARKISYAPYDLVIAVGGDGTFLEASRRLTDVPILGVNSDPARSVGFFCGADAASFEDVLAAIIAGRAAHRTYDRICIRLNGKAQPFHILNDVLIAHQSPAAMSRYCLEIGARSEDQRGSGLWISTAAGAGAGIRSAGGMPMPPGSKKRQYRPRELHMLHNVRYALTGGIIASSTRVRVRSMMREGVIFIDGPHLRVPFPHGDRLEVVQSTNPLRVVVRGRQADA